MIKCLQKFFHIDLNGYTGISFGDHESFTINFHEWHVLNKSSVGPKKELFYVLTLKKIELQLKTCKVAISFFHLCFWAELFINWAYLQDDKISWNSILNLFCDGKFLKLKKRLPHHSENLIGNCNKKNEQRSTFHSILNKIYFVHPSTNMMISFCYEFFGWICKIWKRNCQLWNESSGR